MSIDCEKYYYPLTGKHYAQLGEMVRKDLSMESDAISAAAPFGREDLKALIDAILEAGPHSAISLGHLLLAFRSAIESGLSGINQARNALTDAIDLVYLHSPEHAAALNLYRQYLAGELLVNDEPLRLINDAIERNRPRDPI